MVYLRPEEGWHQKMQLVPWVAVNEKKSTSFEGEIEPVRILPITKAFAVAVVPLLSTSAWLPPPPSRSSNQFTVSL